MSVGTTIVQPIIPMVEKPSQTAGAGSASARNLRSAFAATMSTIVAASFLCLEIGVLLMVKQHQPPHDPVLQFHRRLSSKAFLFVEVEKLFLEGFFK